MSAMPASDLALIGSPTPRIGPPRPLRHDLAGYRETALALGITPMPWQDTAATYLTAMAPDGRWLYRECAVVVGRQNGKTTLVKPLIVRRLRAGRRIMHIAQVRELPRIMFEAIADYIEAEDPSLFPTRRGKIIWPRRGAGSESIVLTNGGTYRIAAAGRGGARGHDEIDDLLIDELREAETWEVINAAKPAQRFSENPQTIYLSNAGTDDSVVLNALRTRSGQDPNLAYLEWSADPDFDAGDRRGWVQANPSIGHFPQVLEDLEKDYTAALLSGNMAGFETEALCRWVQSMRDRLVDATAWDECAAASLERPRKAYLGVAMAPEGTHASAALAFQQSDGTIGVRIVAEAQGNPVDIAALGADLRTRFPHLKLGYDPMTDAELAKFFRVTERINGQAFTNASARFVSLVEGRSIRHLDSALITEDLSWTARKEHDESGSFQAVRIDDDRPITSALAAIRAVWLASGPRTVKPRIY